ncbi:hypothetical protein ACM66B_004961 [Microbotryomycetes sp. NB124-2]
MLVHALSNAVILEQNGMCLFLHAEQQGKPVLNVHFGQMNELSELDASKAEAVVGCIGIFRHLEEMFAVLIKEAQPAWTTAWGAEIVKKVIFYSIENGRRYTQEIAPSPQPSPVEIDMGNLAKFLSTSDFYFSVNHGWDATLNLSDQAKLAEQKVQALQPIARSEATSTVSANAASRSHAGVNLDQINSDPEFIWNLFLLSPLFQVMDALDPTQRHEFDKRPFAIKICQGYFGSRLVMHGKEQLLLTIISRRRWARAGPRFYRRGIDKDGNCANAAETETILRRNSDGKTMSFVQVRASVPIYWKEKLAIHKGPDVSIREPVRDSVEPLKLHFHSLLDKYPGGPVHVLNLMMQMEGSAEQMLGEAYAEAVRLASDEDEILKTGVVYGEFDGYQVRGGPNAVPPALYKSQQRTIDDMGHTEVVMDWKGEVRESTRKQVGVYRVNCRDCLDRTTLAGFVLSEAAIERFVKDNDPLVPFGESSLQQAHRDLFAESGDTLSDIYAGSPAMTTSFIRNGHKTHQDLVVQLKAYRSRIKQALFLDSYKQNETSELTEMFAVLIKETQPASMSTWGAELVKEVVFYSIESGQRYSKEVIPSPQPSQVEIDMGNLAKFLSTSEFFFSASDLWDVTLNFSDQAKLAEQKVQALQPIARSDATLTVSANATSRSHAGVDRRHIISDPQFVWNLFLLSPLFQVMDALDPTLRHEFDKRPFAIKICQGYFGSRLVMHKKEQLLLTIISRRRWARAGPRFYRRGIDKDGNCANAAETETILRRNSDGKTMSFVQVHASVPIYWKETLSFDGGPAVTIHKPLHDSVPPLELHLHSLLDKYSAQIHILDLMRTEDGTAEEELGVAYAEAVQMASVEDVSLTAGARYKKFDVHKVKGGQDALPEALRKSQQSILCEIGRSEGVMDWQGNLRQLSRQQKGVYRINCRDCLDRTTLATSVLSEATVKQFIDEYQPEAPFAGAELQQAHRDLFAENGDTLSQIYAGSPAETTAFIRSGRSTHESVIVKAQIDKLRVKQALFWDGYKMDETNELTGQPKETDD